jgi:hypothetical protein
MNTHNPGLATSKHSQPTDTITDTALGAVESVKNTAGDAVHRGQAAVTHATAAASDMAKIGLATGYHVCVGTRSDDQTQSARDSCWRRYGGSADRRSRAWPDLIGVATSLARPEALKQGHAPSLGRNVG